MLLCQWQKTQLSNISSPYCVQISTDSLSCKGKVLGCCVFVAPSLIMSFSFSALLSIKICVQMHAPTQASPNRSMEPCKDIWHFKSSLTQIEKCCIPPLSKEPLSLISQQKQMYPLSVFNSILGQWKYASFLTPSFPHKVKLQKMPCVATEDTSDIHTLF